MTILIAERSDEIRNRIENLIDDVTDKPEIYQTDSLFEAIDLVETKNPDYILLDIDLEDGSGFTLMKELKNNSFDGVTIVFTNQIKERMKELSFQLGADYFLNKSRDFLMIKNIFTNSYSNHN